jgi:hypothetical protein
MECTLSSSSSCDAGSSYVYALGEEEEALPSLSAASISVRSILMMRHFLSFGLEVSHPTK